MANYDAVEAGILMEGMTSDQKLQFHRELTEAWRDPKRAGRLKTWLGGIGAHHRYLGDSSRANKCLLFCWTGIPVLMTMFEGDIRKRTERVNSDIAMRIATRIKGVPPLAVQQYATMPAPPTSPQSSQSSALPTQPILVPSSHASLPQPNMVKQSRSGVLKWALIGVGLVMVLLVGAGLAARLRSREIVAARTSQPSTQQASSIGTPGAAAEYVSTPIANEQPKAESRSNLDACLSGGATPELVCLSEELERQDARLNVEYKRVMAQYRTQGQTDKIASLRKVELDWLKRVQSECDATPTNFVGNPDRRRIECRLDLTRTRADELAKMP